MVVAGLALLDDDIEGAIESLKAIIDNDPFNDHVLVRLAEIHILNGYREDAYVVLEKVGSESMDGYNAAILRSRLLIDDENYEDAAQVLENALEIHPGEALVEFLD